MASKLVPTTDTRRPPNAGKGRTKGTPNKTTAILKQAILLAAEEVGEDGKGKGGTTGYCRRLALQEPKAFASLMGRILPTQVTGEDGGAIRFGKISFEIVRPSSKRS
jgi:hypothetical protein